MDKQEQIVVSEQQRRAMLVEVPRLPTRPLAHRHLYREWPERIQHLWRACRAAEETLIELDLASANIQMELSGLRIEHLTDAAWAQWCVIERYAEPLVAAFDRGEMERGQ